MPDGNNKYLWKRRIVNCPLDNIKKFGFLPISYECRP
jgi:hypothetical protein